MEEKACKNCNFWEGEDETIPLARCFSKEANKKFRILKTKPNYSCRCFRSYLNATEDKK
jgi:hypothetical protein